MSFIRNVWISATPSASITLPFTYPHILTLLTSNSLLSLMIASLASVIQLSLTYSHVPDEAKMKNNHQASYFVSIHLIFVFQMTILLVRLMSGSKYHCGKGVVGQYNFSISYKIIISQNFFELTNTNIACKLFILNWFTSHMKRFIFSKERFSSCWR